MIDQSFSIYHFEYFLAILVRIMGAMANAPIFGNANVTRRVKILLSVAVAFIIFTIHPYEPLEYTTFMQYTGILIKELLVGITIGFLSNITLTIVSMAGQFIDRELGFSMVSNFDQTFNTETTITAEFYNMLIMIIMLSTNMHYFIITALSDSFEVIPLGKVSMNTELMMTTIIQYMTDYFVIAFRISLPIMISIMLLNVVLGVLAKTAPQLSMFVIGIQLKIILGFAILMVTLPFLGNITRYIYEQMETVVKTVLPAFF